MGKVKAKISPNHENAWDLGRECEMKKVIMGKGNGKLVKNLFLKERESKKQPFFSGGQFFLDLGND